jgi:hypothetical protein
VTCCQSSAAPARSLWILSAPTSPCGTSSRPSGPSVPRLDIAVTKLLAAVACAVHGVPYSPKYRIWKYQIRYLSSCHLHRAVLLRLLQPVD